MTIRRWGNARQDDEATQTIEDTYKAESGILRVTKNVFPQAILREINSAESAVRSAFNKDSMPFSRGVRLVVVQRYDSHMSGLRSTIASFFDAVARFASKYEEHVDHARTASKGAWDPDLVPDKQSFVRAHDILHRVSLLPTAGQEILDVIDLSVQEQIRESERQHTDKMVDGAVNKLYAEILEDLVKHAERVKSASRIQDVGFERLVEILERIPDYNLTQDPKLASLHEELLSLTSAEPALVRADIVRISSDEERSRVAGKVSDLISKFKQQ